MAYKANDQVGSLEHLQALIFSITCTPAIPDQLPIFSDIIIIYEADTTSAKVYQTKTVLFSVVSKHLVCLQHTNYRSFYYEQQRKYLSESKSLNSKPTYQSQQFTLLEILPSLHLHIKSELYQVLMASERDIQMIYLPQAVKINSN